MADGVIGIPSYLLYRAVTDMNEDTAIVMTEKTGGLFNGRLRTHQNPPLRCMNDLDISYSMQQGTGPI